MKMWRTSVLIVMISFVWACGGPAKKESAEKETTEKESTEKFNDLADEEGFADSHDEPLELEVDALGKMSKVAMPEGQEANIYSVKKEGSSNYLLVFHEWWGLNNHIIAEADRLYEKLGNVNVIAVDLYDGKVTADRDKAGELMKGADSERCNSIIAEVLNGLPEGAKVGTIGWCFGGGWSLKAALAGGSKTEACVMYYGMPVEDVEKLKTLNSDVLFIFAEKDQWINKEVADKFKSNMQKAGKEIKVLSFDADHAFANPSSEKYIEEAAQEANAAALEYLKERLK